MYTERLFWIVGTAVMGLGLVAQLPLVVSVNAQDTSGQGNYASVNGL